MLFYMRGVGVNGTAEYAGVLSVHFLRGSPGHAYPFLLRQVLELFVAIPVPSVLKSLQAERALDHRPWAVI
jgi:hypothetical protein